MNPEVSLDELQQSAVQAASLLKALSNECRLLILCNLLEGEMTVSQLNERVELSQSALSQHLAKLRAERLVRIRKEAQNVFYSIDSPEATAVIGLMAKLYWPPKQS